MLHFGAIPFLVLYEAPQGWNQEPQGRFRGIVREPRLKKIGSRRAALDSLLPRAMSVASPLCSRPASPVSALGSRLPLPAAAGLGHARGARRDGRVKGISPFDIFEPDFGLRDEDIAFVRGSTAALDCHSISKV